MKAVAVSAVAANAGAVCAGAPYADTACVLWKGIRPYLALLVERGNPF